MIAMKHSNAKTIPGNGNDCFRNDNEKRKNETSQFQPRFGEFQLIGDNLLLRFTYQILYNTHKFPFGARKINYCINGQRIEQLRQRIILKPFPLSSKVMVMIGTNDVLYGGNIRTMKKHFKALLTVLKKSVDKILILTLPPIPKLSVTFYHWTLIRQYNAFLKSFEDGKSIFVADIYPLFTKFTPALEFEIRKIRDPHKERVHHGKKRSSWQSNRRTKISEKRRSLPNELTSDESDYRSSTDTENSADSEVLSSDDREYMKNDLAGERMLKMRQTGNSENFANQRRLFVRNLESVFGKELLNRKKSEDQSGKSSGEQPEKSPMDLNENLCPADNWLIESGDDSMNEHVYKSQEEMNYDFTEFSHNGEIEGSGEFSRFVESLNEIEASPKRTLCCRQFRRDSTRNEKSEDVESSSSSSVDSPKRHFYPIIDPGFRHFLEKSEFFGRNLKNYSGTFHEAGDFKHIEEFSKRDNLLLSLSSQICNLELYEVFHFSKRSRIDMIHLNYKGLNEVKNFLISNNYVEI